MIDTIVKLAEKIAELLMYRSARRKERFGAIIEPMFTALQELHKDYLLMFEKVRQDLLANEVDLLTINQQLRTRRIEHEATRRSVQGLAKQLKFLEFEEFLRAVQNYFHHPGPPPPDRMFTGSNMLQRRLDALERYRRRARKLNIERDLEENLFHHYDYQRVGEGIRAVDQGLEQLRADWNRVAEAYAKALEASLK